MYVDGVRISMATQWHQMRRVGGLLGSNVPELQRALVGGQQQLVEVGAGVHSARHVEV